MKLTETEIEDLFINLDTVEKDTSINNGGSSDYYKLNPDWTDLQDVIEAHDLNFAQGNILKAAFAFNIGRHSATTYERDLNKIIWFAKRELDRLQSI